MANTNAQIYIGSARECAQLTAGRGASALGLSSETMMDVACTSGSAILTDAPAGLRFAPPVLLIKGLENIPLARAQHMRLVAGAVLCLDPSLAQTSGLVHRLVDGLRELPWCLVVPGAA